MNLLVALALAAAALGDDVTHGAFAAKMVARDVARQTMEVGYPYVPGPYYGAPVWSAMLLNHTFYNSYGVPAEFAYAPPPVAFNRVVLTLHTSIAGRQYDRLAHLVVGGAEVWRTSTIEPHGRAVHESAYSKDVLAYLASFERAAAASLVLGNINNAQLLGAPAVELYALFYWADDAIGLGGDLPDAGDALFATARPASRVYGLTGVTYLPQDPIEVAVAALARNTTRVTLLVFALGNADEEFWYTNAFLQYTSVFAAEGTVPGYGPARVVNVYCNGAKVATQSPQPFVFTGGISPYLWTPVVAPNAFDLPSLDIDLTALLPSLWLGARLAVEVSNATGGTTGSDWIVLANLLAYEAAVVAGANGRLTNVASWGAVAPLGSVGDGTLAQSIGGEFHAKVESRVAFDVAGGTLDVVLRLATAASVSNAQQLGDYGNVQLVAHWGASERTFDALEGGVRQVYSHRTVLEYPLDLVVAYDNVSTTVANISVGRSERIEIGGQLVYHSATDVAGDSTIVETSTSGYGHGDTSAYYRLWQQPPFAPASYQRTVVSKNNTLVSDTSGAGLPPPPRAAAAAAVGDGVVEAAPPSALHKFKRQRALRARAKRQPEEHSGGWGPCAPSGAERMRALIAR